jgi:F0F1-type ATP synthase assembly protein I
MWTAISEIRETGHRTETAINELRLTVNPALNDLRQDVDANARIEREHHDKHDARLTALEQASWSSRWVPAIVSSVLVGAIVGVLVYVITHI